MKTLPISGIVRYISLPTRLYYLVCIVLPCCLSLFAAGQNCTINSGINQTTCSSSVTLTGNVNGTTGGIPTWSFVSGPATPVIANPNNLVTNVTGLTIPGNYVFQLAQPCQLGGTATQTVTVTAYPEPVFSISSPEFSVCANYAAVNTLSATPLLPGWTGRWTIHERVYGGDVTSHFSLSASNAPITTVQLLPAYQVCGNHGYVFRWTITSPNGLCSYSRDVSGYYYPDINQVNFNTTASVCSPGIAGFGMTSCAFWSLYLVSTSVNITPISAPAGFTGTLTGTIGAGVLNISGLTMPGTYTFNATIGFPVCGTSKSYGPFTVTVGNGIPSINFSGNPGNTCLSSMPASLTFNFMVGNANDSVYVETPTGPYLYQFTGMGTTNRSVIITPVTSWIPGEFRFAIRIRGNADSSGACENRAVNSIFIYDGNPPLTNTISNSTACIPSGLSTATATIRLPRLNVSYLGLNFGWPGLNSWQISKISGPAAGGTGSAAINDITCTLTGLVEGVYTLRATPTGGPIQEELACSGGFTPPVFTVTVYNQQGANAGTNQSINCIQSFPLAANAPLSPSVGTWSQVSGPTPMQFSNIHDPNALAVYPSGQAMNGSYTFRWTISDPNGNCPLVSSDVVITSANACAPLPLTLISFTAKKQGTTTLLEWATASEQNTRTFIIEWSRNGSQWEPIGQTAAAGNSSSVRQYQYQHLNPVKGVNYYRLRQVDADERTTYSRVVAVSFTHETAITVFPNPVSGTLYLSNVKPGSIISIYGTDGKRVNRITAQTENVQADLGRLSGGIYVVAVTDAAGTNLFHTKILKQ